MRICGLVVALVFGACTDDGSSAIENEASRYLTFHQVNARAFPTSQHQGNPNVNVWTNDLGTPAYRMLSSGAAADPEFPVGSMIVKEMLDPDGASPILTVLSKQPPGFDPAHRDWWYGRLQADGTPTNSQFVGKVGFCIGCHAGAGAGGYVFGIAADNLAP